jgi:hypothetical protein
VMHTACELQQQRPKWPEIALVIAL